MIGEMMILAMLLCLGLEILAYIMRMWPVSFISSMGWVIISLQLYQESEDLLVTGLILVLAVAQIIMIRDREAA